MLKKELLELCLLHLLAAEDRYGYELLETIRLGFPGTQESAIYAQLRALCREGLTEWYEGAVSGGPTRKYYRITRAGHLRRDELLTQWRRFRDALATLGVV